MGRSRILVEKAVEVFYPRKISCCDDQDAIKKLAKARSGQEADRIIEEALAGKRDEKTSAEWLKCLADAIFDAFAQLMDDNHITMAETPKFLIMDRRSAITDKAERDYCSAFNILGNAISKAHRFTVIAKRQFYSTQGRPP